MVAECEKFCAKEGEVLKCAFMSTPSIYYSLKNKEVKAAAKCLDVSAKTVMTLLV